MFEGYKESEVIQCFLQWMEERKAEQDREWNVVVAEDSKVQDFLHEMEFEEDEQKRAEISKRLHESRVKRRKAKDRATLLKPLMLFASDANNRGYIKRLMKLEADIKFQEDYQESERYYIPTGNQNKN